MSDFTEEKLELGYDYGAVGGMRFKTTIIKTGDKQEQRNVDWWLPLGRWQLGERTLLESDIQGINEVIELRNFHAARKGSKQGFRFKDWSDYKVTNQHLGTADGQQDQWQLKKTYFAGDYQTHRPITKPVSGTVKIYLDDIEALGGWSVDYSTGVLSFDTPPPNETVISCDLEFDVPVWFENDEFSWTLEGYQKNHQTGQVEAIYRLGNLAVEEGRIPLALPWYHLEPLPQQLSANLDLGIIENTSIKNQFDTSKEQVTSGYVRRDSNIEEPERIIQLEQKIWNSSELEQLLGFFWNCKGRAGSFALSLNEISFIVRFDIDNLAIKFLASNEEDSLFSISGLKFSSLVNYGGLLKILDRETYIKIVIDSSASMNAYVQQVIAAVEDLTLIIKAFVFDNDEAAFNKYFKGIEYIIDERWLTWINRDLRDSPSEPDKVFYLVWVNKSDPWYHKTIPGQPPTELWQTDLNGFLTSHSNREKFGAVIYAVEFDSPWFDPFATQLENAYDGIAGYNPPLKDYGIFIRPRVSSDVNANYYFYDLLSLG